MNINFSKTGQECNLLMETDNRLVYTSGATRHEKKTFLEPYLKRPEPREYSVLIKRTHVWLMKGFRRSVIRTTLYAQTVTFATSAGFLENNDIVQLFKIYYYYYFIGYHEKKKRERERDPRYGMGGQPFRVGLRIAGGEYNIGKLNLKVNVESSRS